MFYLKKRTRKKTIWETEVFSGTPQIDSIFERLLFFFCLNLSNFGEMRARHKDAKGTQYSYEDHYEDDDYMNSYDDSYTPSMGNLLFVFILL